MNSLYPILGKGSFDHGSHDPRFQYLINDSDHPLGRQLKDDWTRMQRVAFPGGVPLGQPDNLLAVPATEAGTFNGSPLSHVQKLLTQVMSESRVRALKRVLASLPLDD